jgi:hypothetical protein
MRSTIEQFIINQKIRWYRSRYTRAVPGSPAWLIGAELKYGGIQTNVPRHKVSPHDPRSREEVKKGGMTGGDRFLHHGYAKKYAHYLKPYLSAERPLTLIEVGILKGTGLAIWSELFPNARIIGLDIDLSHFENNRNFLEDQGAFQTDNLELHEFDQFVDNSATLETILNGDSIDIFIDDGFHSNASILTTMKSVLPFLADTFVYFVEDNRRVHTEIRKQYPQYCIENDDRLTIIT